MSHGELYLYIVLLSIVQTVQIKSASRTENQEVRVQKVNLLHTHTHLYMHTIYEVKHSLYVTSNTKYTVLHKHV